jgi:archaemetzincin
VVRSRRSAVALALVLASQVARAESPPTRARVVLVTLGRFPAPLADAVDKALRDELQVEVKRIDEVPLPQSAWYAPRKRYRAEALLSFLDGVAANEPAGTRVLGMTDVDISTTKGRVYDWGVFGLGEIGRRNCVISIFRLRRGAKGPEHLAFRVSSTAVHEVGHTLGLPHCPTARCVMQDAEGSIRNTDAGTGKLCASCRATVDRLVPIRAR